MLQVSSAALLLIPSLQLGPMIGLLRSSKSFYFLDLRPDNFQTSEQLHLTPVNPETSNLRTQKELVRTKTSNLKLQNHFVTDNVNTDVYM